MDLPVAPMTAPAPARVPLMDPMLTAVVRAASWASTMKARKMVLLSAPNLRSPVRVVWVAAPRVPNAAEVLATWAGASLMPRATRSPPLALSLTIPAIATESARSFSGSPLRASLTARKPLTIPSRSLANGSNAAARVSVTPRTPASLVMNTPPPMDAASLRESARPFTYFCSVARIISRARGPAKAPRSGPSASRARTNGGSRLRTMGSSHIPNVCIPSIISPNADPACLADGSMASSMCPARSKYSTILGPRPSANSESTGMRCSAIMPPAALKTSKNWRPMLERWPKKSPILCCPSKDEVNSRVAARPSFISSVSFAVSSAAARLTSLMIPKVVAIMVPSRWAESMLSSNMRASEPSARAWEVASMSLPVRSSTHSPKRGRKSDPTVARSFQMWFQLARASTMPSDMLEKLSICRLRSSQPASENRKLDQFSTMRPKSSPNLVKWAVRSSIPPRLISLSRAVSTAFDTGPRKEFCTASWRPVSPCMRDCSAPSPTRKTESARSLMLSEASASASLYASMSGRPSSPMVSFSSPNLSTRPLVAMRKVASAAPPALMKAGSMAASLPTLASSAERAMTPGTAPMAARPMSPSPAPRAAARAAMSPTVPSSSLRSSSSGRPACA